MDSYIDHTNHTLVNPIGGSTVTSPLVQPGNGMVEKEVYKHSRGRDERIIHSYR